MLALSFKTADLCDEHAKELQVSLAPLKSYGKKKQFSGSIQTVKVLEDNVLVKEALQTIPEGSVLVVDGAGSKNCALLGDRLGDIAVERRLAGIIIYGCVRDSAELSELDIGILALGTNPLRSVKLGKGERDIPVTFGSVEWKPGSYVYADEDGVVVSERKLI